MFKRLRFGIWRPPQAMILAIILAAAVGGDAAVSYWGGNPAARTGLGLLLLGPIVWASARLGVVERVVQSLSERRQRRFHRLRAHVEQLLAEIRRLNWLAVDANRGFRSQEVAIKEMDAIENRLREMVAQIRSAAGLEDGPDDDPPSSGL